MSGMFQVDLDKRLEISKFAEEYGENIAKAEVAVTIAQARRSEGITQQELAERLGKNQSYIAKLESGDANPTVGKVGRILAKMGLRLIAGINGLNSSIEKKELSYLSVDASQAFIYLNNSYYALPALMPNNMIVSAVWALADNSGKVAIQSASGAKTPMLVMEADNMAGDSTDVLWQAPREEKQIDALKLKGEM